MRISHLCLVVNPRAPVRAWKMENLDETRDFKNLAEFEAWYHPGHHGGLTSTGRISVRSQFLYTDVLLDRIDDLPAGRYRSPAQGRARDSSGGDLRPAGKATAIRKRQGVVVDDVVYNSAWDAFQKLGLGGVKECVKFRTELKRNGTGTYGGKSFKIVEE